MIRLDDIRDAFRRNGLAHLTLAEHGAVCPPGYHVEKDADGNEVCRPDAPGAPSVFVVEAPQQPMIFSAPRGGPRHHHAHRAGPRGLGAPSATEVSSFRAYTRAARAAAAGGDTAAAQSNYAAALAAFASMGSPPAYQDELDYARDAAYGTNGAVENVQAQETNDAVAQQNLLPYQPTFADVAADPLGSSLQGLFEFDQDLHDTLGTPKVGARGVELTAAQMRALGLPGADPQSGRDLTTKPPVPIPSKVNKAALGAAIGGGLGATVGGFTSGTNGAVGGGIGGALLGGVLGYFLEGSA